jgi:hypothetical protein
MVPDTRQIPKHQQKQKAHVQPRYFENTFFAQEGVKFHHLGARYVCTVVIILILVAQFPNIPGSTLLGEAEQMPWSAAF